MLLLLLLSGGRLEVEAPEEATCAALLATFGVGRAAPGRVESVLAAPATGALLLVPPLACCCSFFAAALFAVRISLIIGLWLNAFDGFGRYWTGHCLFIPRIKRASKSE